MRAPPTVVVAAHELRLRMQDRSVLLLGLLAPFVLASIMGLSFGGGGSEQVTIALVDADHSALSARIMTGDLRPRATSVRRFVEARSEATARRDVKAGDTGAAIVIPEGFGAGDVPLTVIGDRDRPIASGTAASVARQLSDEIATGAAARPARISDDRTTTESSPLGFFGPSMAILFLYFSVGSGARSLLAERRQGTLARLRVAPIHFRAVVAGKLVAIFVVALASMLALWVATMVLFDASWGSVPGVLVLCTATIFAIAGIAAVIAARAQSEASADAATGMVAFLLALFGGNFFPPGALPDLFEKGSRLTPNGAALQAFARLSIDDAPVSQILPALLVLTTIGVVLGGWGFTRLTAKVTDR
jgi:ABC-2 type transport system permease protein